MRFAIWMLFFIAVVEASTVKVGILHSLTGTLAQSEKPVVDATLLAIQEINANGGVLGRKIEAVIFDGKSEPAVFAQGAEKLIREDQVAVIFGCWTSSSRKAVKEVVEKYNHILFYPVQYEGYELSPNIIYTGSAPNQQIIPGVSWAFFHLGKRFFLVGSDYVFPRKANETMKKVIQALGGEILGEEYIPLGSHDVESVVEKIAAAKPDVVVNTINGDTNTYFFKSLREKRKITPEMIPSLSFSLVESEMAHLEPGILIGDYAVWSYFHSVNNPVNDKFIGDFKKMYGDEVRISDPMEAGYIGVHLWAESAKRGGSVDPKDIKAHLKEIVFNAPEGVIYIDAPTQHTWKYVRIGKMKGNNIYEVIWNSEQPVQPIPFPY